MAQITALYDVLLVAKIREATFTNDQVLLATVTGGDASPMLTGTDATTKFTIANSTDFRYFLNGTEYAVANMQAPMNAFGVIHLRWTSGISPIVGVMLGARFNSFTSSVESPAEADIAEAIFFSASQPMNRMRELVEHLINKWGV